MTVLAMRITDDNARWLGETFNRGEIPPVPKDEVGSPTTWFVWSNEPGVDPIILDRAVIEGGSIQSKRLGVMYQIAGIPDEVFAKPEEDTRWGYEAPEITVLEDPSIEIRTLFDVD
jgi:hypothetical protein